MIYQVTFHEYALPSLEEKDRKLKRGEFLRAIRKFFDGRSLKEVVDQAEKHAQQLSAESGNYIMISAIDLQEHDSQS